MVRTPCTNRAGLKKGTWTIEEDRKLIAYVTKYGCWNWRQLPKYAGLSRCGKSCRLRWLNYLRPDVKRGNFTKEEEDTIIKLHASLGNRWSAIAAQFPGRTDNDIKNHWHSYLKKRSTPTSSLSHQRDTCMTKHDASILEKQEQVGESCNRNTNLIFPISPRASQNDQSSPATTCTNSTIFFPEESDDDFWTKPFVTDEEFDKLFDLLRDEILLSPTLQIIGEDFPSLYDDHVIPLQ